MLKNYEEPAREFVVEVDVNGAERNCSVSPWDVDLDDGEMKKR